MISTKNVPIGTVPTDFEKGTVRVKGVDSKPIVLAIPIGSPNLKEAIDKAIESYPGAVGLADGVVKSNFWHALVFGKNSYIVEGTPLLLKGTTASQYLNDQYQPNNYQQQNNYQQPSIQQQQYSNAGNDAVVFYHTVKQGETIQSIAQNYNVTVRDIINWNQLNSNTLSTGKKLKIYVR